MNRIQFWVLTYSVILIAPLFLTHIYLSGVLRKDENNAILLQRIAQDGPTYNNRWQQLATRIYQASQQDPAMRDVLTRQHVNITPRAASNAAPASAPETAPAPTTRTPASSRTQAQ